MTRSTVDVVGRRLVKARDDEACSMHSFIHSHSDGVTWWNLYPCLSCSMALMISGNK